MTTIKLILRPLRRDGGNTGSLTVRLIHDRRVKTLTLRGCRLYRHEWDKDRQTIIYPENDAERTEYLDSVEKKVSGELETIECFVSQLSKSGPYTMEDVTELYLRKKDEGKLSGYVSHLAGELERNGQYRTAKAYRTVVRGLVKFNKGEDIPLNRINRPLLREFEKYLKEQGKMPNTVSYYFRNLRAIYNKGVASKRINCRGESPFRGISTSVTKTMKRALTLEELQSLYRLDIEKLAGGKEGRGPDYAVSLRRAWRYFFFCFYARGMCFIDLAYLRKDNIRGGFIRYCRKKTGQQIEIRITQELQNIMDSFEKEVARSPYVFPVIADPNKDARLQYESAMRIQNDRLKRLSTLAGIARPVSTHVARHSWATVGKQQNVPIQVLSECLGHTSPDTTMIYLAMLDNRILDDANELVIRAVQRPAPAYRATAGF